MASVPQCLYAFDVLHAHFESREPISLATFEHTYDSANGKASAVNGTSTSSNGTSYASTASSSLSAPLFVTWNKKDGEGGFNLRGCIGTFDAQPLETGIRSYAIIAALQDTRFNPVTAKELPKLQAAISVLTDFEPAEDAMDWELGEHGLRISFTYHGRRMGATYLPDVPVEQGWTKEETIVSLMRKAGWYGNKSEWRKVTGMKVIRYRGTKAKVSYEDYKKYAALAQEEES